MKKDTSPPSLLLSPDARKSCPENEIFFIFWAILSDPPATLRAAKRAGAKDLIDLPGFFASLRMTYHFHTLFVSRKLMSGR